MMDHGLNRSSHCGMELMHVSQHTLLSLGSARLLPYSTTMSLTSKCIYSLLTEIADEIHFGIMQN